MIRNNASHGMRLMGATFFTLALASVPTLAAPQQNQNAPAPTPPAMRIADYAQAGQLGDVLSQLKNQYGDTNQPAVQSLISQLESFEQHQSARAKTQQKDYRKAIAKVQAAVDAGAVEDSLVEAINAKTLAPDKQKLLDEPIIKKATALGAAAARKAAENGSWVRAISLYRLLDDLHKIQATYHKQLLSASRHVQILQVYAPAQLAKLYQQEQDALAKQQIEKDSKQAGKLAAPLQLDLEKWQTRLADVNESIFKQTIERAATQHVSRPGYQTLMQSAVHELQMMVDTPQLTKTFSGLADAHQRAAFADYLSSVQNNLKSESALDDNDCLSILADIKDVNQKTVKLPGAVIAYELTEGVTDHLDRFSRVIWPTELRQFSRTTNGTFYGVGIQLAQRDGELKIITPLAGTPAAKAGVMAGDVIAEVNGQSTVGWSLDQAIRKITGPEGSPVTLGLKRAGDKALVPVTLKRAKIAIQSILGWEPTSDGQWNYWIDRKDRIGYIRLTQFIPQTADDLDKAVHRMQASGPIHGLILDLRFNPGGLLTSAAGVADRFITHGPIVFTVRAKKRNPNDKTGPDAGYTLQAVHRNAVLRAHQSKTYPRFPLVVLINGGTASAAEIVTGALQDYHRAEIVGTRSYGKGSVQDLFPIDNDQAYFKLTRQYYMLPLGRIIHRFPGSKKWGIDPDIKVPMTPKQMADAIKLRQEADVLPTSESAKQLKTLPKASELLNKGIDPQLETALLVLKTKLVAHYIAMAGKPQTVDTP